MLIGNAKQVLFEMQSKLIFKKKKKTFYSNLKMLNAISSCFFSSLSNRLYYREKAEKVIKSLWPGKETTDWKQNYQRGWVRSVFVVVVVVVFLPVWDLEKI